METNRDLLHSKAGHYVSQTKTLHDVKFIVGEGKVPISAIRIFLINQSKVWWLMLSPDSYLAEQHDIHVPDIEPGIFQLLLEHCYGALDDLNNISVDDVVQLCYCANKYMMESLMKKIGDHMVVAVNEHHVFPALYCLINYNLHYVRAAVINAIQNCTTHILSLPDFLKCDVECLVFILKQERLNCPEIYLWRAVVHWAKYNARMDGNRLRQLMKEPLKHIRLLTLTDSQILEVFADNILNGNQMVQICQDGVSLESEGLCGNSQRRDSNIYHNNFFIL